MRAKALWGWVLVGWWWASYKSNFCPEKDGFQSSCIGQYFWEQCSRGRCSSNGWTVRSYISRFHSDFFFSLVRDYTLLSHHVQLVAELPIIDAKRENYHRGNVTQKGAEGCGIAQIYQTSSIQLIKRWRQAIYFMDSKEKTAGILNLLSGHNPSGLVLKPKKRKHQWTFSKLSHKKITKSSRSKTKKGKPETTEADDGRFSGRQKVESYTARLFGNTEYGNFSPYFPSNFE